MTPSVDPPTSSSFWSRPMDGDGTRPGPADSRPGKLLRSGVQGLSSINNLLLPPLATLMVVEAFVGAEANARLDIDWWMLGFCALFGTEWLGGLLLARSKRAYLLNFWLLADLLSSVPFSWVFQAGRFVRFARITRVLRLGRVRNLSRMARVARLARMRLDAGRAARAVGLVSTFALSGAIALRATEPETVGSLFEGLYWALVTITAVGYGDITPETVPGRLVGMVLILLSLGVFGYAAALASSALDHGEKLSKQGEILAAIRESEERTSARIEALEGALRQLGAEPEDVASSLESSPPA